MWAVFLFYMKLRPIKQNAPQAEDLAEQNSFSLL